MESGREQLYTMAYVRQCTGLSDRQIRYYEQKGWVTGHRTAGNQRRFDREAIDTMIFIRDYLGRGQRAFGLEEALLERKQAGRGDLAHRLNQIANQENNYQPLDLEWRK